MANRKPLVIGDTGKPQQLQARDNLDVPLEDRVAHLESKLVALATALLQMGLEIPPTLLEVL